MKMGVSDESFRKRDTIPHRTGAETMPSLVSPFSPVSPTSPASAASSGLPARNTLPIPSSRPDVGKPASAIQRTTARLVPARETSFIEECSGTFPDLFPDMLRGFEDPTPTPRMMPAAELLRESLPPEATVEAGSSPQTGGLELVEVHVQGIRLPLFWMGVVLFGAFLFGVGADAELWSLLHR
jgi:hypothetical protein